MVPITSRIAGGAEQQMPQFVTRIFKRCHLGSTQNGYFRFGTLSSYAKGEGRFSDTEEGTRLQGFNAASSSSVTAPALGVYGGTFGGNGIADVLISHKLDLPVACLSLGPHNIERSHAIMAQNPDLSLASFVVYDSVKLELALCEELARPEWFDNQRTKSGMVGRNVDYEERMTMAELNFLSGAPPKNHDITRMVWVKPVRFAHEEEYRLALFGSLLKADKFGDLIGCIAIESSELIKGAIVDSGNVPEL